MSRILRICFVDMNGVLVCGPGGAAPDGAQAAGLALERGAQVHLRPICPRPVDDATPVEQPAPE